jgi:hypothetical protein
MNFASAFGVRGGGDAHPGSAEVSAALSKRFPCREAVLARLLRHLTHSRSGSLIFVHGPPATGKTTLIRQACTRHR